MVHYTNYSDLKKMKYKKKHCAIPLNKFPASKAINLILIYSFFVCLRFDLLSYHNECKNEIILSS